MLDRCFLKHKFHRVLGFVATQDEPPSTLCESGGGISSYFLFPDGKADVGVACVLTELNGSQAVVRTFGVFFAK